MKYFLDETKLKAFKAFLTDLEKTAEKKSDNNFSWSSRSFKKQFQEKCKYKFRQIEYEVESAYDICF